MCSGFLYNSVLNISHSKTNSVGYCHKTRISPCKILFILVRFLMKPNAYLQIPPKIFLVWNSLKIRPVGAELFHADGRTDRQTNMTKLIVAFRNFAALLEYDFDYLGDLNVFVCVCVCVCVCVRACLSILSFEPAYQILRNLIRKCRLLKDTFTSYLLTF